MRTMPRMAWEQSARSGMPQSIRESPAESLPAQAECWWMPHRREQYYSLPHYAAANSASLANGSQCPFDIGEGHSRWQDQALPLMDIPAAIEEPPHLPTGFELL